MLDDDARRSLLLDLELVDLAAGERRTGRELLDGAGDPEDAERVVRSSMARGLAHPVSIMSSATAASRAARLDECLTGMRAGIRVDSTIGSAIAGDIR